MGTGLKAALALAAIAGGVGLGVYLGRKAAAAASKPPTGDAPEHGMGLLAGNGNESGGGDSIPPLGTGDTFLFHGAWYGV